MFRHQTHPQNVHPYQTTVVPRSDAQFHNSTQQRMKYPWLDNPPLQPPLECQSTNSSNSENYQVPHHYTNVRGHWTTRSQADGPSPPLYHSPQPVPGGRMSPSLLEEYSNPFHGGREIHTYSLPLGVQGSSTSVGECRESAAGVSPAPISVPSDVHGGCGGHCPGFEYVCYYVLQIIFVVGILTGISLCIAGSVLRRSNRGGDLGVLVYIGFLTALVCCVLLAVQCCARRRNRQRSKQMRLRAATSPDCIQLDTIPNLTVDDHGGAMPLPSQMTARQMQPLIFPAPASPAFTFPRDYYRSSHRYNMPQESPMEEVNSVPWWRRQKLPRPH